MPRYRVDVRDDNAQRESPIGFVLEVEAPDKAAAKALLERHLPQDFPGIFDYSYVGLGEVRVYFYPEVLTDDDFVEED